MSEHLIDGEFQSDKYPTCPRGKVPLSCKDPTAQDLLWQYAQRRRPVDAAFSDDLEQALRLAGYAPTPAGHDTVERVARAMVLAHGDDPDLDVSGDPRYDIDVSVLWEDYRLDAEAAIAALASVSAPPGFVPEDVRQLVIAARNVAFDVSRESDEALQELDAASEAFAERVPWENEPNDEVPDGTCSDCPPAGYPTNKTRCAECPRASIAASVKP